VGLNLIFWLQHDLQLDEAKPVLVAVADVVVPYTALQVYQLPKTDHLVLSHLDGDQRLMIGSTFIGEA